MPSTVTPGDRRRGDKVGTDEHVVAEAEVVVIIGYSKDNVEHLLSGSGELKKYPSSEFTSKFDAVVLKDAKSVWGPTTHKKAKDALDAVVLKNAKVVWSAAANEAESAGADTSWVESLGIAAVQRGSNNLRWLLAKIGSRLEYAVDRLPDDEVAVLADRIAAVLPSQPGAGAEAIGPVFETADLTAWRGVSKQAIDNQRRRHSTLALRTADAHWVYPEWQFDEHGHVREGVAEAVKALTDAGMDPWTQAVWFRGASPDLNEESAAGWLTSGKDPAAVVQLASRTANRWRQ